MLSRQKFPRVARDQVCAYVAAGFTRADAARFVGCHVNTIRHWATHDLVFRNELRRAEAKAQALPLENLRAQTAKSWRAAAWLLERLNPGTFRPKESSDPTVPEFRRLFANLLDQILQVVPDAETRDRISAVAAREFVRDNNTIDAQQAPFPDSRRAIRKSKEARRQKIGFNPPHFTHALPEPCRAFLEPLPGKPTDLTEPYAEPSELPTCTPVKLSFHVSPPPETPYDYLRPSMVPVPLPLAPQRTIAAHNENPPPQ